MEKVFPRGGKVHYQNTKKYVEEKKDDDVFKIQKDLDSTHDVRRRKKQKGNADKAVQNEQVTVVVEPLSFKTLTVDMIILGYVSDVRENELKIMLPGCVVGTVPITNISRPYTDLLKKYTEDPSGIEETIIALPGLFSVGQIVISKITTIEYDPKTSKTKVELSLNPTDINSILTPICLFNGMSLQVAVESVEDYGYTIDTGIRGLTSFLKNSKHQHCQLAVGQLLSCVINMEELCYKKILEGRMVMLSTKSSIAGNEKIPDDIKITLHALQPGMKLSATVMEVRYNGLIVECMGYTGCIFKDHLKNIWDHPHTYKIGQQVEGTVLYVHPVLQHIYLSLHFVSSPQKLQKMFGEIKIGSLIEGKVHHIDKMLGVYFMVDGKFKALCPKKHLSDKEIEDVSKEFPLSSTHKCRVVGVNYIDHLLKISLRKSVIEQKYIPHEELKVGVIFKGTVKKLTENGMVVKLAHGIHGFVRDFDMSDIKLHNPEKMFYPGKEIKCRILRADISKDPPAVLLTCKKTLVKSKLPVISRYEECYPGLLVEGTIALIKETGVLVSFYNDVKGWVPPHELGTQKIEYPEKIFYKGQCVKCRVTSCIPEKQNLKLSFKVEGQVSHGINDVSQGKLLEVGKIVDVEITAVSEKGLDVALISQGIAAFLPVGHLSDHRSTCPILLSMYEVGDVIHDVVCFSTHGIVIVSKKSTIVHSAKENKLVKKFSDLKTGITVPAVVRGFASYGMFVEVSNNISGLVPIKMMLNERVVHSENAGFSLHQTVMAKIINIDEEKERVTFSTKLADCYFGEAEPSIDLLESYIEDQVTINEFYKGESGMKRKLSNITIGQVINAKVTKVTEIGVICKMDADIPGLVVKQHLGSQIPSVGDMVQAVVLYVDIINECVELLLDERLVKAFNKSRDEASAKPRIGQVIKCQVAVVKHDFVLVILKGHAIGTIAYLPLRRHLNDLHGRSDLYAIGDCHHIVIKRIVKNNILGVLKQHDHDLESLLEKAISGKTSRRNLVSKRNIVNNVQEAKNLDMIRKRKRSLSTDEAFDSDDELVNKRKNVLKEVDIELEVGKSYKAIIKSVKMFQLNILVDGMVPGRIHITEISSNVPEGTNPLESYRIGQQLDIFFLGYRYCKTRKHLPISHANVRRRAECSLKQKHCINKSFEIGEQITVFIKEFSSSYIRVWVSPEETGKIFLLNLSNSIKVLKNPESELQLSQALTATVCNVNEDHIELTKIGMNKLVEGKPVTGQVLSAQTDTGVFLRLPFGYCGTISLTDLRENFKSADTIMEWLLAQRFVRCQVLSVDHITKQCILSTRSSRLKGASKEEILDREIGSAAHFWYKKVPRLQLTTDFPWDFKHDPNVNKSEDSSSDSEDEDEKRKHKKKKLKTEKQEEEYLFQREIELMNVERQPETVDDFERLLLSSPNSSMIWMKYMAFHLQQVEIEKAKAIGLRAIKVISFREEQEKLNIWVALLNLEISYGTAETLKETFQQALQYNEPIKVYKHMVNLYIQSNKYEEAEDLYKTMVKKFRYDKEVHISFGLFFMKQKKLEAARNVMQRSLNILEKKEHVDIISRFAQMEFKYGDAERGTTMFESLLSSYPKRTDLWSIYIDLIQKHSDLNAVRHIFERVTTMTLAPRKMKFFFQRYLEFEKEYGNTETVEKVKQEALQYVEEKDL